jgi:hypothetical protein
LNHLTSWIVGRPEVKRLASHLHPKEELLVWDLMAGGEKQMVPRAQTGQAWEDMIISISVTIIDIIQPSLVDIEMAMLHHHHQKVTEDRRGDETIDQNPEAFLLDHHLWTIMTADDLIGQMAIDRILEN